VSLTRVFSKGAFELGGRLYAPIQNYTKDNRKYYHFDGDPTIEIDYSSIHPHMLYHKQELEFDGDDPYTIEGFDRGAVKLAFNIMLNRKAVGANKSAAKTISKEVGCDGDAAEALEAAIQALHSPIAHHFNTGVGLTLQRLDSDIALLVIDQFVVTMKRPILCVHDSFIVSVRDTESLILTMEGCYKRGFNDEFTMRSIKADALEFNEALTVAINRCFEQDTDDLDNEKWDELIAEQGITDCTVIDVNDGNVDEYG
jgi:hypothetical protein